MTGHPDSLSAWIGEGRPDALPPLSFSFYFIFLQPILSFSFRRCPVVQAPSWGRGVSPGRGQCKTVDQVPLFSARTRSKRVPPPPEKLRGVFRPHSGCALCVQTDAARLPPGMRSEAADADAEAGSRTRLEDQSRRRPGKDTGEREGTLRCDGGRTPEGAPSLGGQCAPSGGWPGPGPSPSGGRQVFASPGAWGRGRPLPESRPVTPLRVHHRA